ncbi:Lrp/AsnC family transcriptional regulator [Arthrobacter sp. JCM 19049]|uniref:Lrp/AsnC family transcriptional regulator n=1 Tax=Arthrobacter sp. JCM 19049 TaxID=1460643 RepID=UPI000AEB601C|nr:winged helix-turn-helix transcriptional regulator [Arthrobacter sp. JCM 19049]
MADSKFPVPEDGASNPVRVDATDLAILAELGQDARVANNVLAARVGLAPSTCLGRVRALQARGIIQAMRPASTRSCWG